MMAQQEVERELHSCGLWFFVEFYEQLRTFTTVTEDLQEDIRQQIIDDLKYKRRPDGCHYQDTGTDIRIASAFIIFKKEAEQTALAFIANSNRVDPETKSKAASFLNYERNKKYEIRKPQEPIQPKIQKPLFDTEIKIDQPIIVTNESEQICVQKVLQNTNFNITNVSVEETDKNCKTFNASINGTSKTRDESNDAEKKHITRITIALLLFVISVSIIIIVSMIIYLNN